METATRSTWRKITQILAPAPGRHRPCRHQRTALAETQKRLVETAEKLALAEQLLAQEQEANAAYLRAQTAQTVVPPAEPPITEGSSTEPDDAAADPSDSEMTHEQIPFKDLADAFMSGKTDSFRVEHLSTKPRLTWIPPQRVSE